MIKGNGMLRTGHGVDHQTNPSWSGGWWGRHGWPRRRWLCRHKRGEQHLQNKGNLNAASHHLSCCGCPRIRIVRTEQLIGLLFDLRLGFVLSSRRLLLWHARDERCEEDSSRPCCTKMSTVPQTMAPLKFRTLFLPRK